MANKKRILLYISLLALTCMGTTGYFTLFRSWDYQRCEINIAQKLKLDSGESIYTYLQKHLVVGITRSDALSIIENIGQYEISSYTEISGKITTDVVKMKICWHPMNNVKFYLHYDSNELLKDFNFEPQF